MSLLDMMMPAGAAVFLAAGVMTERGQLRRALAGVAEQGPAGQCCAVLCWGRIGRSRGINRPKWVLRIVHGQVIVEQPSVFGLGAMPLGAVAHFRVQSRGPCMILSRDRPRARIYVPLHAWPVVAGCLGPSAP